MTDTTLQTPLAYPPTATVDVVDDYHGTKVPDPYRWLEDLDSPETVAWVEAQNRLTFSYLEGITFRDRIRTRLTELWDYEKWGLPFHRAGRHFVMRNDGLQNQFVLYTMDGLEAEQRVLLDPNTWSPDGTKALFGLGLSEDARRMAYGVSTSGSDWQEWKVLDVETGEDLPDHLRWIKFSGASWTHDGAGFFYSRYDEPEDPAALESVNYFQKLCYHRVGTTQSEDVVVYERPDRKEWGFGGGVTEDGRYLVIRVWVGTEPRNGLFYRDLSDAGSPVVELLPDFDASYGFVGNDGPVFWFVTDLGAPRKRLVAIDTRAPERARWREIVPEAGETLLFATCVGDRFFCHYLRDAHSVIRVYGLDGTLEREVDLPGIGSVGGFGGRRDDEDTFYAFTSFTEPGAIYRYEVPTGESTLFRRSETPFDGSRYQSEQVFYESKDGTRVPMFLVHRKGIALDGSNPTYLYGYGGFNIPLTPAYAPGVAAWLEMGGVYAAACLRGGGEYGEEWHLAGARLNRQNVFDDFIAAAEWLMAAGYTTTPRLSIGGGSNGGLLVGASVTQRPDLFGAARIAVGVLDMLRFHRFTIGWAWVSDYGSPDDPEEFKVLHSYSPLHNVRPGARYPAILLSSADHDDRVVPSHTFKFASAMQAAQAGAAPVLARIDVKAGHGMGKPTQKIIEESADGWAFLAYNLGFEPAL